MCKVTNQEVQEAGSEIWVNRKGEKIATKDMSDAHCRNALNTILKKLRERANGKSVEFIKTTAEPDSDIPQTDLKPWIPDDLTVPAPFAGKSVSLGSLEHGMFVVVSEVEDTQLYQIEQIEGMQVHLIYMAGEQKCSGGWIDYSILRYPTQAQIDYNRNQ